MAQDLSAFHHPVGDLIGLSVSSDDGTEQGLSDEQLDFYHEHGYVAGVRLLADEQVDALCRELGGLSDPAHPGHELFYEFHANESSVAGTTLFHALGAWRITPGFHDVLWTPAFTAAAAQLVGGAVRFWHDQLFSKPPRHGGVVAWHQDYSYWTRTKPMAHLTCFIALDDTDGENGCLHYVPGSHRWPLLPITGLAGDMNAIQTVLSEEQEDEFRPVPIELRRGEASFHHPLLVHGSFENRSDRPCDGPGLAVSGRGWENGPPKGVHGECIEVADVPRRTASLSDPAASHRRGQLTTDRPPCRRAPFVRSDATTSGVRDHSPQHRGSQWQSHWQANRLFSVADGGSFSALS